MQLEAQRRISRWPCSISVTSRRQSSGQSNRRSTRAEWWHQCYGDSDSGNLADSREVHSILLAVLPFAPKVSLTKDLIFTTLPPLLLETALYTPWNQSTAGLVMGNLKVLGTISDRAEEAVQAFWSMPLAEEQALESSVM